MRTSIIVTGLQTFAFHGLFDEEQTLGQKFSFDVHAYLRKVVSHLTDNVDTSVRCDHLIDEITRLSSVGKFRTLEALGETVARGLLDRFDAIRRITIVVSKVSPPIPQTIERVAVEICLFRDTL